MIMTKSEIVKGYKEEIAYQNHTIQNLNRWLTLSFIISSIGVLLIYFFKELLLLVTGIIFIVIGLFGILLFGYGIYKGKQNLSKVIQSFEKQLQNF